MRKSRRLPESWPGAARILHQLQEQHQRAAARAKSLQAELAAAHANHAEVRALERRRLVQAVTATTLRHLDQVRSRLWRLRDLLAEGLPPEPAMQELAKIRTALDEMIDSFRTTVRGVYPAMLPDRGPRAALEELAATLPRPVRFDGDLGRRVEWQIESGLYHAVAAVLNLYAGTHDGAGERSAARSSPITVVFGRDEALQVRITAEMDDMSLADLRSALAHDAARLAVLGGAMRFAMTGNRATVDITLAKQVLPPDLDTVPSQYATSAVFRQVWELARQGRRYVGYGPERAAWLAVAERMSKLPRIAVVLGTAREDPTLPSVPYVNVIQVHQAPNASLAEEFLADDGPRGRVDAVVCLVPPDTDFRTALRYGRHRVMLIEADDVAVVADVAKQLQAQAPTIAARRALVSIRELVQGLPADHELRRALDQVSAERHEFAELDLLVELTAQDTPLLRTAGEKVRAAAARLLGAEGPEPWMRLGLSPNADKAVVRATAQHSARYWRSRAQLPTTGGKDREVYETLAATAERLVDLA